MSVKRYLPLMCTLAFVTLLSCTASPKHESNDNSKHKEQLKQFITINSELIAQLDTLTEKNKVLEDSLKHQNEQIDLIGDKISASKGLTPSSAFVIQDVETYSDSLIIIIEQLKLQNTKLKEERKRFNSKEDNEIKEIILALHREIEDLPKKGKPDDVMKLFLPRFSVNQVLIDHENKGHIEGYTHEDYALHLKDIDKHKGYTIDFYDTEFLELKIKDNKFFNVMYASKIKVFNQGIYESRSDIGVTVTGRKENGVWKIASYSRVQFQYKD